MHLGGKVLSEESEGCSKRRLAAESVSINTLFLTSVVSHHVCPHRSWPRLHQRWSKTSVVTIVISVCSNARWETIAMGNFCIAQNFYLPG